MDVTKGARALYRLVGLRVMKTALATVAAIYIAMLLHVDNPQAAGVLAILGVDTTRWRGIMTVYARFAASLIGLAVASAVFVLAGFYVWTLALYILIAFPLLTRFKMKEGIVTGAVIVFHLFHSEVVSWHTIRTELALLAIGLGSATAFNLAYMPKQRKSLESLRQTTEDMFVATLGELAKFLRDPATVWNGDELLRAEAAIEEGLQAAKRSQENRLSRQDEPWLSYFAMRREQLDMIQLMMENIAFVSSSVPQSEAIASLLDRLIQDVRSEFYEGKAERALDALEREFKAMPLPATREEFEIRAALLHLCRELRRYLTVGRRGKMRRSS
ncbi:aromatic acid exporter family protein [Cohnella ginsengisoli]|uniref:Aromatic acid exporter family protein n=1 Tax=Cohnella ginsengisoli TaxID=425004 RepID=A0A9X4KCJ7_9BACL|nr:aromatic acid exporter family protein [Cohnella ginsengisoli]MDG0789583.1 aromatic acid exporter family protein [Cohnella ginsengisoli]